MKTGQNWALELFRECGIDLRELRNRQQQDFSYLVRKPSYVPLDSILKLLNAAGDQLNDPFIGLHLAEHSDIEKLGTYGYLLANAATLGNFFQLAEQYCHILIHTTDVFFECAQDLSVFSCNLKVPTKLPARQHIEMTLGMFLSAIKKRLGENWQPYAVHFGHAAPDNTSELRRFFGDNLHFSQQSNFIRVDSKELGRSFCDGDPQLLGIIMDYADRLTVEQFGKSDTLVERIRQYAAVSLAMGEFTLPHVAKRMGVSVSTIKRHLTGRNLKFSDIKMELVGKLSRQLLQETDLPIGTIALDMGYTSVSAFDSAFKRISGLTPRDFRNQNHLSAERRAEVA